MSVDTAIEQPGGASARRPVWVAAIWVLAYLAVAAGLPFVWDALGAPDDGSAVAFAIGHAGLPVIILAGLVFVRRARWHVWTVPAAVFEERPRRRWMLLVPIALLAQALFIVATVPWADRAVLLIVVIAVGTALVGLGEELFFRGILRSALDARHGETLTLLVTSITFGLAHSVGSMLHGLPLGYIALQVSATMLDGVLFFAALKATGTLWVPITLHALADFGRYLTSGNADPELGHVNAGSAVIWLQFLLGALAVPILISAIRADLRARTARTASAA